MKKFTSFLIGLLCLGSAAYAGDPIVVGKTYYIRSAGVPNTYGYYIGVDREPQQHHNRKVLGFTNRFSTANAYSFVVESGNTRGLYKFKCVENGQYLRYITTDKHPMGVEFVEGDTDFSTNWKIVSNRGGKYSEDAENLKNIIPGSLDPSDATSCWNPTQGFERHNTTLGLWIQNDGMSAWEFEEVIFDRSTLTDGHFGENMHWYALAIQRETPEYPHFNSNTYYNDNTTRPATWSEDYLYAFVPSLDGGYQIYNYKAGAERILWSGDVVNNMHIHMMDRTVATDGNDWEIHRNGEKKIVFKKRNSDNGWLNDVNNTLGYWKHGNAATDGGGTFKFETVKLADAGVATEKVAATIPVGYNFIYTIDEMGGKHFLKITENGSLSLENKAVSSFEVSAGVTAGGAATAGVYYLTMNGYRISNWNGKYFNTNAQKNEGLSYCQALEYDPVSKAYAIRCTNANSTGQGEDKFITFDGTKITASDKNTRAYQWFVRSGYPFDLTVDDRDPHFYGIKSGRGDGWWYSFNESDQTISLNAFSKEDLSDYFYFAEAGIGGNLLQVLPLNANRKALGYSDQNQGTTKIFAQDSCVKTNWEFVKANDPSNGYGLKIVGTDIYMSNYNGTGNKMGLYGKGPDGDGGSKMYFERISDGEIYNRLSNAEKAERAKLENTDKDNLVGYPTADKRKSLLAEANNKSYVILTDYLNVRGLVDQYVNAEDINLPVDGKAYVFTNVHPKAEKGRAYLKYTADGLVYASRGDVAADELPVEAKFICHSLDDGRFAFVNNEGKFLVLKGNGSNIGINGNKGYVDAFDATYSPMTFAKMKMNGQNTSSASSNKAFLGMVAFGGKRGDRDQNSYFMASTSPSGFNQDGGFTMRYSNDHSTAFVVEEVAYNNGLKLNTIEGNAIDIQGASTIATFSAPFATKVPANVEVFYVKGTQDVDGATTATLSKFTGTTIPANEGVILVGNAQAVNSAMIPSIESPEKIAGNLLVGTAGAPKVFVEGEEYYLLGKSNNVVGLFKGKPGTLAMNKAYLPVASQSFVIKLYYHDDPTGVDTIVSEDENGAIYDLSGRRVTKVVKGGIYIKNGKKFIVK